MRVLSFSLVAATLFAATGTRAQDVTEEQRNSVLFQTLQDVLSDEQNFPQQGLATDTLSEYTAKCAAATGLEVPGFNCDNGSEVPGQEMNADGLCDRPNVLNRQCDPGSRFQVLAQNSDAAVVAHCRKVGLPRDGGMYNDIAVIQYNKANGALCFYQALTNLEGTNVRPPSEGETAWPWLTPKRTEGIGCTGCHDNGGFIRSPYIAQMRTPPNALPNEADGFNNRDTPARYVGADFANDRSWSITAEPASCPPGQSCLPCNTCHRLAVNNHPRFVGGTAIDLALRATARTQTSKVEHSESSPIWMRPGQVFYSEEAEQSATKFHDCGQAFVNSGFTSVPDGCTATPLGMPFSSLPNGRHGAGDSLEPGDILGPGEELASANGSYRFVYQDDGNLVLYRNDGVPLWASNTAGSPAGVAIMQDDGNLVVYAQDGSPAWASGTQDNLDARLVVQDDGNVVVYNRDGSPLWATNTSETSGPVGSGDDLQPGEILRPNDQLVSANGQYKLVYQSDGNLVLYGNDGSPLWASNTEGSAADFTIMQGDGNLVIYAPGGTPVWASDTANKSGAHLAVQDDGNVVIYGTDGTPLWATNTVQ